MNREIKFRIWTNNRFCYKCLVGNTNDIDDEKWTCPVIWLDDRKEWVNCDNGIICQYTGLKDKNGVEIYEGDEVNIQYQETIVENAIIEYKGASFYGVTDYDYWELDEYLGIEVIGNVYEGVVDENANQLR